MLSMGLYTDSMRFSDDDIRAELNAVIAASTLRQVAKKLGVTPAFVSQVSRGNSPPGPKIAAALGYMDDGLRWVKADKKQRRK